MMRILQMCRNLGTGGIEAVVCGLSNEMVKEHDVTVCTIVIPSVQDKFYRELDTGIHRETIGRVGGGKPFREIVRIAKFIKAGKYDIVHIHGFFYYYVLAILLYHRKAVFVYTVHSDAFKENNPWDRRILFFKRFCFRHGWVHPITISSVSKNSFTKLYGCQSRLIANGVVRPILNSEKTVRQYRITDRTKVFLHASRICPEKNQVMLCKVFDRLIQEGNDIVLLIAGPIHHHEIYAEMQNYFQKRILYIGDRSDVPSLLCSSDGMCLSSYYEGLPIILLESLAAGCIPICTAVGGVQDVITDGVNGFLANAVSEASFYHAMKRYLLLGDDERTTIKNNCLDKSELFAIGRCARNHLNYYEELRCQRIE